jgi:hypothetical protein
MLAEMLRVEVDFNVESYFNGFASNHVMIMYLELLKSYKVNSAKTNHHITCFLKRVQRSSVWVNDFGDEEDLDEETKARRKTYTLEPILFRVPTLQLFSSILEDPAAKASQFRALTEFIRSVVRNFFRLASKNHAMYVEALRQTPPHPRSAALAMHLVYGNEDVTDDTYHGVVGLQVHVTVLSHLHRRTLLFFV